MAVGLRCVSGDSLPSGLRHGVPSLFPCSLGAFSILLLRTRPDVPPRVDELNLQRGLKSSCRVSINSCPALMLITSICLSCTGDHGSSQEQ